MLPGVGPVRERAQVLGLVPVRAQGPVPVPVSVLAQEQARVQEPERVPEPEPEPGAGAGVRGAVGTGPVQEAGSQMRCPV